MTSLFINSDDFRLRAGWRLVLQVLLLLTILFILSVLISPLNLSSKLSQTLGSVLFGISILLSVGIMSRYVDYRSLSGFGLTWSRTSFREFWIGSAIGFVAMTLIWVILLALGFAQFTGFEWQSEAGFVWVTDLFAFLGLMLFVGFYEEVWSRGYQLKVLAEALQIGRISKTTAVSLSMLLTSVLFGLLHLGNPGSSLISSINISLAGIMLALPYVLTGRLWLSIGIHFSWNFAQGGIFGFPVSGLNQQHALINTAMIGPEWFTGGGFGPEAGVISQLLLSLMAIVIIKMYKSKALTLHAETFLDTPDLHHDKVKLE
jgi:hypothetical protein